MIATILAMAVEPAFAYILVPALVLSAWSKIRLKLAYRKYDKKITSTGMSGGEIARKILDENKLYYVRVGVVEGELTDYYDPINMMLCLSEATYYTCSVAAAGIAAHEAGHAIQHVRKYFPMVLRKAAVPLQIWAHALRFLPLLPGTLWVWSNSCLPELFCSVFGPFSSLLPCLWSWMRAGVLLARWSRAVVLRMRKSEKALSACWPPLQ